MKNKTKKPLNKGFSQIGKKTFSYEKEFKPDDHNGKIYCGTVRYFGDVHAFNLFGRKGSSRSYNLNQRTDLVTNRVASKLQSCFSTARTKSNA